MEYPLWLAHGKINHVGHQGDAASVAVGEQSEKQRAQRTHRQRGRQAAHNGLLGNAKVRGERIHHEDDDEKIEGIECPAEKARGDCVEMAAGIWSGGCVDLRHSRPRFERARQQALSSHSAKSTN